MSQSVSSLENTLGIRLFNRLGRRLVLTSEGRALSRRFHMVQEALAGTLAEIVNEESEVRGLIRLGLFLGSFRSKLAGCLRTLLDEHPGIRVKLRYGSQAELAAMLLDGRLDLAKRAYWCAQERRARSVPECDRPSLLGGMIRVRSLLRPERQ